jgi:ATP-dependent RNA helicase RhlE
MNFDDLDLPDALRRGITEAGYTSPTPIQAGAIPVVLEGNDLFGIAQTGTGKTAAFAIPILTRLATTKPRATRRAGAPRPVRALVLAPTRELASQIGETFRTLGKHLDVRSTVIFGGVGHEPQVRALIEGVDVLVATPGRLLDLAGQRRADLSTVEWLVLDEADRMLDMGFVHDVKRILALLPRDRQSLLFSATMPDAIVDLAGTMLRDPKRVEVTPNSTPVERIRQHLLLVQKEDKRDLLSELVRRPQIKRALVFTRTKHGANRLTEILVRDGVEAVVVHGNKSQNARERALEAFRDGTAPVLVATDIAARGIDIDGITHVINFDLPHVPEDYVHRIGRTARAGASGVAISLCEPEQVSELHGIVRLIGKDIPIVEQHPYRAEFDVTTPVRPPPRRPGGGGGRGGGGRSPRGGGGGGGGGRGGPGRPPRGGGGSGR